MTMSSFSQGVKWGGRKYICPLREFFHSPRNGTETEVVSLYLDQKNEQIQFN